MPVAFELDQVEDHHALADGELVEADPESWLISDGKLYFFGKREGPELFRQNLSDNIAKANQNRPLIRSR